MARRAAKPDPVVEEQEPDGSEVILLTDPPADAADEAVDGSTGFAPSEAPILLRVDN